jgi:hypothetical protein
MNVLDGRRHGIRSTWCQERDLRNIRNVYGDGRGGRRKRWDRVLIAVCTKDLRQCQRYISMVATEDEVGVHPRLPLMTGLRSLLNHNCS